MSALLKDIKFGLHLLAKYPGSTAAALLALALGIGANSAIFCVMNAILLRPLPFHEPDRLMEIRALDPHGGDDLVSPADFLDWKSQNRAFTDLAGFQVQGVILTGKGEPLSLAGVSVTPNLFKVLGTQAAVGRTFVDGPPGTVDEHEIVLGYGLWQREFGADPKVVGQKLQMNDQTYVVVGVAPRELPFPREAQVFVRGPYGFPVPPAAIKGDPSTVRRIQYFEVLGRLRPGVSRRQAEVEMVTIQKRLAERYQEADAGRSARVMTLSERLFGNIRPALVIIFAACGFVLLIACANVASLLLARAASRQREIALRTAIGAGRGRLIAQLLTESGLLAVLGGGLGVALAAVGLRAFAAFLPAELAGAGDLSLSGRVLAWTALLCLVTCLLAGLAPALQLTRPDLSSSLREGSRGSAGAGRSRRTQRGLVVAEVALAVLLLVGAGLLLRSFSHLLAVHPGFEAAHALSFEIDLPDDRYAKPQRAAFFARLLDRLSGLPGVTAAGAVSGLPMGGEDINGLTLEGRPAPTPDKPYLADDRQATPGYFNAMGIPLRRGRLFAATDTADKPPVAVVDEVLARSFWPGEDALGKRFQSGGPKGKEPWITVIGVVGSVRNSGLHVEPRPQMYRPEEQAPSASMAVVLRTPGNPESLATAARATVHEVDRDQPVSNFRTLDQLVADSVAGRRFNLLLLGLFAALALTLSGVGIYGVTAYSVVQRTREMGLRIALGSQPGQVLRLVVGEAGLLAGMGVLLGLLAAFALTRVMSTLLYGVATTDPPTFAVVALGLLLIALAAACLPGMRATRVDPMVALRGE